MWPEGELTQELLLGVANGDESATNRLMDRHRDAVRRMIQMRLDHAVARRVDASDVVQDVLMEASQRLKDYMQNPHDAISSVASSARQGSHYRYAPTPSSGKTPFRGPGAKYERNRI